MSREPKKKPGEMQKARKRHLAKQALSDKIKVLKDDLEKNKEVWYTHVDPHTKEYKRLRLTKFNTESCECRNVLARVNGKIQVLYAPDKYSPSAGSVYLCSDYFSGYIPKKQVLAEVVREYSQ